MEHPEHQYLNLLNECRTEGVFREGRNGGTYGLFGRQIRFDLSRGFPLLTTKKVNFRAIVVELLWFLRGETNIKYLHDHGVHIWDEWADEEGNLGPVYGSQWRSWDLGDKWPHNIDQIENLIQGLKKDPSGRRHIVTAWNPAEIPDMALFQFFVADGKLSCQLYQRSADIFIGVPFNIASYALLTHMVAKECGLEVGEFVHTFGDVHLYANHINQADEQLLRIPKPLPKLWIGDIDIVNKRFNVGDVALIDYHAYPAIKAPISV